MATFTFTTSGKIVLKKVDKEEGGLLAVISSCSGTSSASETVVHQTQKQLR